VLCLFAGLTVFNIGLANRPASTDTTLDLISVMVKAFDEGEGGDQEIGGPGTCGWRVWAPNAQNGDGTFGRYVFECGVNKATADHMMGLCALGYYTNCNWCCNSCSSTTYCGDPS